MSSRVELLDSHSQRVWRRHIDRKSILSGLRRKPFPLRPRTTTGKNKELVCRLGMPSLLVPISIWYATNRADEWDVLVPMQNKLYTVFLKLVDQLASIEAK